MIACCNAAGCVKATRREKGGVPTCQAHGGKTVRHPTSYTYEVQVHGDERWYGNEVRFQTEAEAKSAGNAKYCAWSGCAAFRVVTVKGPANYRWHTPSCEHDDCEAVLGMRQYCLASQPRGLVRL